MARKFQISDTVEVVKTEGLPLNANFKIGHRGKIIYHDRDSKPYCYTVKRKNGNEQHFTTRELKLIKRARNEAKTVINNKKLRQKDIIAVRV